MEPGAPAPAAVCVRPTSRSPPRVGSSSRVRSDSPWFLAVPAGQRVQLGDPIGRTGRRYRLNPIPTIIEVEIPPWGKCTPMRVEITKHCP